MPSPLNLSRLKPLFLALCLTGLGLSAQAAPDHAAMFRNDAQLSGVADAPTPARLEGVRFVFRTGAAIRSTPALYRGALYFGNGDGHVYAVDARTGQERWRVATDGPVSASPAAIDGTVFFTTRGGSLWALDAAGGRVRWKHAFGKDLGEENYWDFYTSSPIPFGPNLYVGSGDGGVYALDRKSGRVLWRAEVGSRVRSTPAVTEDLVVFGTVSGHVMAVDRHNGAKRWDFATDGASHTFELKHNDTTSVMASPTIHNGAVVIGGRDGMIYGLDLATGAKTWRTTHDGASWILSTAAEGERVYIGSGSASIFQAADLATGVEAWRLPIRGAMFGSPDIAGEAIVFGDFGGFVNAVDKRTGASLWRFAVGDRVFSTPVVGDGAVFVAGDNGVLYALNVGAQPRPEAPAKRLVFWEAPKSKDAFSWFVNNVDLAILGYFKGAGYEQVDGGQLRKAMLDQIEGRGRSIVVFAEDRVPPTVFETPDDKALIRRYLDAGGRVAFLGSNPLAFLADPKTGEINKIDNDVPDRVLGTRSPPRRIDTGYHISQPTPEGAAWGLSGSLVTNGTILPDDSITVLTRNEFGKASGWVKHYGGPDGGAVIQLTVPRNAPADLTQALNVIEHGTR